MTDFELYWLAGLIEGDGCISWEKSKNDYYGRPILSVGMTDYDVVERVKKLIGAHSVMTRKEQGLGKKDMFIARVSGEKAALLLVKLIPLMGIRRSTRMKELLDLWIVKPNKRVKVKPKQTGELENA